MGGNVLKCVLSLPVQVLEQSCGIASSSFIVEAFYLCMDSSQVVAPLSSLCVTFLRAPEHVGGDC